jgi:hypothetical protein
VTQQSLRIRPTHLTFLSKSSETERKQEMYYQCIFDRGASKITHLIRTEYGKSTLEEVGV